MMRRAPAQKRRIDPDPVFRSVLVSQVINKILLKGKKDVARTIVYDALEIVERRSNQDPVNVLKRAIDNLRPQVEVRSRRVGGSSYQVPVEVSPRRSNTLAIRWLVGFARRRKEPTMAGRLANEILDASNNSGAAVKRKEDVHKMAESNRAFAHYRW
ncbi:MAG: 30S ribosomal protein S7 [Acidimicrobiia bacterium]|nr:30S ribosomal protein S7 [Acidimicrobiia bacterium]MDH4309510.1 30S ribosomal protein S7 [Acidimicrobiia bacterium]